MNIANLTPITELQHNLARTQGFRNCCTMLDPIDKVKLYYKNYTIFALSETHICDAINLT